MPRLAIFTAPKPFTNSHIALIQDNAIRSWKAIDQTAVEVWLVGKEEGIAEKAAELGVNHAPEAISNLYGTPLVSSIFQLVREQSSAPYLCYVNADILLFPDLLQTLEVVSRHSDRFLLVGQRWDMNLTTPLNFYAGWQVDFISSLQTSAKMHAPAGSDYFVFPRDQFSDIPDFAVGRAGWDNWMIYHARRKKMDVVNATGSITAVHQNHDFSHLPGGKIHRKQPESLDNLALASGRESMFTLYDTNRKISQGKIVSIPLTKDRLWREISIFPLLNVKPVWLAKGLYRILNPGQAIKDKKKDKKMKAHIEETNRKSR